MIFGCLFSQTWVNLVRAPLVQETSSINAATTASLFLAPLVTDPNLAGRCMSCYCAFQEVTIHNEKNFDKVIVVEISGANLLVLTTSFILV